MNHRAGLLFAAVLAGTIAYVLGAVLASWLQALGQGMGR